MTHPATTDALPLSDDELAAIRERCDKATPGPWRVRMWGGTNQESPEPPEWTIEGGDGYRVRAEDCYPGDGRDVYFIAHSREDVPRLLATIAERDRTITRLAAIEARAKELAEDIGRYRCEQDDGSTDLYAKLCDWESRLEGSRAE